MIKIFSFIASCAGEKSRTLMYSNALANAFTKKAESIGEKVNYEYLTGENLKINFCRSCSNCFKQGICPLSGTDDVEMLKEKFLTSDIIFFGTPVYSADISGVARCLLDRISCWVHRFELAGKIVAVFSTASSNHAQETADRLKMFFEYMGAAVASSSCGFTTEGHPNVYLEDQLNPAAEELAENLLNTWKNPVSKISDLQEKYWVVRKIMARKVFKYEELTGVKPWDEFIVYKSREMDKYSTYAEYFMKHFQKIN